MLRQIQGQLEMSEVYIKVSKMKNMITAGWTASCFRWSIGAGGANGVTKSVKGKFGDAKWPLGVPGINAASSKSTCFVQIIKIAQFTA
ncbi:MAG: hypothetical protein H0V90_00850 [Blastocatellia bacterium]|nr:hypothetical protein [Blastocatellia bacterium]